MAATTGASCQVCGRGFASWSLLFSHKSTCTRQEQPSQEPEGREQLLASAHDRPTSAPLNAFLSTLSEERESASSLSLTDVLGRGSPLSTSVAFEAGRTSGSGLSANTLAHLDWSKDLTGVRLSSEGSTGVFFAEFTRGTDEFTVVVKGSSSIVQELMCSTLALIMNIRVPAVRLICADQREWEELRRCMRAKVTGDAAQLIRLEKQMNRPFFLVMEFLPAARTLLLPADEMRPLLDAETAAGVRNLRDIGLTLCLDVVANNSDRLPLIWNNDGQLENIIVSQSGQIVAIDNSCCCTPMRDAYLARVAALLDALLDCKTERACQQVQRVRACLKNYGMDDITVRELGVTAGFDIGDRGCIEIAVGVLEGMARFSETTADDIEQIVQLVHEAPQGYDWLDIYETGRKQCSADFFNAVIDLFRARRQDILAALEHVEGVRISSNSTVWQSAAAWRKS